MKRALIISYYWPPSGGSGVQRWVKFAKYLPGQGWQPVIYTPENPELTTVDHTLEEEIPAEAEIIKTRIIEPYGLYRKIFGGGRKASEGEVNPINGQKKSFRQKVSMFIRGNLFIPDPRCLWISPSAKYLVKYLKEHPVDIIISTGPPHSMHLIAEKVARRTGIPWIADFRDPWTRMFYFKHLGLSKWAEDRHRYLEKTVLDNADTVVAVSPLVQEEFQAMTATPVELVTNGYDEEDFDQTVEPDGYFNITHTGLFASDGNPEALWSVLREKCESNPEFRKRLKIRLAGKTDKEILDSIQTKIPFLIKQFSKKKLERELGFEHVDMSTAYFPKYVFKYVSSGGNASTECDVVMDIDNLNRFVLFLSEKIKFKKSAAGQRALMTSKLRQHIKERDNFTCKHCGASVQKEPNLLLEIDHIIPVSKGGLTTEDNLQTLCWRCNRKKGSKII